MATFGTLTLLLAFVVATYGGVASVVGAKRGNQRLIASGRGASYLLAAVLGLASVALLYAFVSQDYTIKYVQHYSDASSPLFYRITAYWGGLDGSILWWVFLLSVFGAIAIHTNRHKHKEILPYTIATIMVVACFFLFLILYHKNPFSTYMGDAPTTGNGLNPLLQNAYMITHPPSLYVGFVGMTIPFAFAMGSLISGHLDDAWIMTVRKWTIIAWFFLAMGLTLGMLWAYEELGWGGFWGWDPVENAGALPWFTATAFLHSIMIQERRGMMKIWNFTLVILTFLLTIFGTFMTRSGIVQSVHAFGQDTKLAWIFVGFMGFAIVVTFGLLIWRLPQLRSRGQLDSLLSREGAFLLNNWILVFTAFFVLFATMYPTLSEAIRGERLTVGIPFFNKWMVPIGLTLLLLTGIGPLIAWRKASAGHLKYQFTWPTVSAAVTLVGCLALGITSSIAAIICFCFCAFTGGTIVQEFVRGVRIRRKNTGSDIFSAFLGMLLRGRRRYGGYIVHVGIVLMFIGFGGQAYKKEKQVEMKPGQEIQFAGYSLKMLKLRHDEDRQKEMVTAEVLVSVRGKEIDRLQPAMWYYTNKNSDRTTEVAIRRSPAEDLYITLGNYDLSQGVANLELKLNPLVDWIWLGFMMLAWGTGVCLLPERVLAPLASRVKEDLGGATHATTAAVLILAASLLLPSGPAYAALSEAEMEAEISWFGKNIMCMCGCRHLLGDCSPAECNYFPKEFATIRSMLQQGKTREEVVQYFIERYDGQSALGAPIDKGFNRLAWALPYGVGVFGAGGLAFGAWRISRKKQVAEPAATGGTTPVNPDLEDKLDEELDKLD